MHFRPLRARSLLALMLTVAIPAASQAQALAKAEGDSVTVGAAPYSGNVSTINADSAALPGPRAISAGITRAVAPNPLGVREPQRGGAHVGAGENVALMAVGGAGVILGLLIGGDGGTLLALGGGVIGLVGLYRYLR